MSVPQARNIDFLKSPDNAVGSAGSETFRRAGGADGDGPRSGGKRSFDAHVGILENHTVPGIAGDLFRGLQENLRIG